MDEEPRTDGKNLRAYPAPWKGELLLACRKCQKKQKAEGGQKNLARIGKRLGKMAHRAGFELQVIDVPCLDLCPKGGVTVCTAQQVATNQCSIVRNKQDMRKLLEQCKPTVVTQ